MALTVLLGFFVCSKGLKNVITAAMNQAFFTLSLGIASMEIFGSYMSRENTLPKEARP